MTVTPRISIIVPNYNGVATLAATLQSVIDQQYPDLELIVVDGGSTDGSVEIIRKYESHLAWWVSENDRGQSDAINKGFARCTGEVVNWLCSDDQLEPGALRHVADQFANQPIDALAGVTRGRRTFLNLPDSFQAPTLPSIVELPLQNSIGQPACFYRRTLLNRTPPLDESLHFAMDLDLWCDFNQQHARWAVTDRVLAVAVEDGRNKMRTGGPKIAAEMERLYRRYVTRETLPLATVYRRLIYPLDRFRSRHPGPVVFYGVKIFKAMLQVALGPFYGGRSRVRGMNWSAYV